MLQYPYTKHLSLLVYLLSIVQTFSKVARDRYQVDTKYCDNGLAANFKQKKCNRYCIET